VRPQRAQAPRVRWPHHASLSIQLPCPGAHDDSCDDADAILLHCHYHVCIQALCWLHCHLLLACGMQWSGSVKATAQRLCWGLAVAALFCSALLCSVLLRSALLRSAPFCSAPFCSVLLRSAPFCSVLLRSAPFCSVLLCSAPPHLCQPHAHTHTLLQPHSTNLAVLHDCAQQLLLIEANPLCDSAADMSQLK
jgi:hypothetical protein